MSNNWWMGKQIVVPPHNGILLHNKKEQITDTCNSTDQSQKHCVGKEKAYTREYIPYNSIYMTFWKMQNYRDRKQISGYQEHGMGKVKRLSWKGTWGNVLGWRKCLVSWCGKHLSKLTELHAYRESILLYICHTSTNLIFKIISTLRQITKKYSL